MVYARDYDKALSELRIAVDLEPNNADAMVELAYTLVYAGKPLEAETLMTKARLLNPNYPGWYGEPAGIIYDLKGKDDLAIKEFRPWYERTFSRTAFAPAALWLAAALAQSGRIPEAVAIANKMGELTAKGIYLGPNLIAIRLATPN